MMLAVPVIASDLKVTGIMWSHADGANDMARLDVSWDHAWHDDRNHDAAWIFLRYTGSDDLRPFSLPALIADDGHAVRSGTAGVTVSVSRDQVGFWVIPPKGHRGAVTCALEIRLADKSLYAQVRDLELRTLTGHGVEMVMIPSGPFHVGDPDTLAMRNGAFHRVGDNGQPAGPFRIGEERSVIEVGDRPGALNYRLEQHGYHGDGRGPIPADLPKGVAGFYIMKYELHQGQYAAYLNDIPLAATFDRENIGSRDLERWGGSIVCQGGVYSATHPERSCAFVTWDDLCGFADWAGLRPMTELEFEKACRGPLDPTPLEYPWNTPSRERLQRPLDSLRALTWTGGLDEGDMTTENRDRFGASYYGAFDLAGNLWERCITVGDSVGRAFKGSHGDGNIGPNARATNEDWPKGTGEIQGIGYRGGAYYGTDGGHGETNPYSPIGYRTYAGWGGAYRYHTYSARFVRTIE